MEMRRPLTCVMEITNPFNLLHVIIMRTLNVILFYRLYR